MIGMTSCAQMTKGVKLHSFTNIQSQNRNNRTDKTPEKPQKTQFQPFTSHEINIRGHEGKRTPTHAISDYTGFNLHVGL